MPAREYVVGRGDAMRVADAVQRYQAGRLQFWLPILLAAVVVGGVGYASRGLGAAVFGLTIILVSSVLVILFQRRRLAAALVARGFRPDARLAAEFGGGQFTIVTERGTSTNRVEEIAEVKVVRGIVLFRLAQARFVVALPAELVPEASLRALRGGP